MGKKRVAIIGEEQPGEVSRKLVKSGKQHGRITDMGAKALAEAEKIATAAAKPSQKAAEPGSPRAKADSPRSASRRRGAKYLQARQKIDRNKFYSLSEAIKILKTISISKFNGSIDVHLNLKKTGVKGEVAFPYPTGKSQKVRIADESLIDELKKGKVNFTALVTSPQMMAKLLPFAKLLGPRGLMPNPKAGTISEKPEELVKKLAGKAQFRAETKFPLLHLTIGKIDSPEKNLEENFKALVKAIGKENIQKAVICPTMGPAIKVDLTAETLSVPKAKPKAKGRKPNQ